MARPQAKTGIPLVNGSRSYSVQQGFQIARLLVAPPKEAHNKSGGVLPRRNGLDLVLSAKLIQYSRQHRELLGIRPTDVDHASEHSCIGLAPALTIGGIAACSCGE
jgi:tRNA A37 threonylcarbamoyltransferase TsaD